MSIVKFIALTSSNCALLAAMTLFGIMQATLCVLVFSTSKQMPLLTRFNQATEGIVANFVGLNVEAFCPTFGSSNFLVLYFYV